MRTGLALFLGVVLAVTPALAQGKTKSSPVAEAVAALDVCEAFARFDDGALEAAKAAGWDAYDQDSESPFVTQFAASRELPGIGWADILVLQESYPDYDFGYCRLDTMEPSGDGKAVIAALAALDRYKGEVVEEGDGSYASLSGTGEPATMLMTHWANGSFVLQLTTITPKTAPSQE